MVKRVKGNIMHRCVIVENKLTGQYKYSDSRSKCDFEVVVIHTGNKPVTKTRATIRPVLQQTHFCFFRVVHISQIILSHSLLV